MSMTFSPSDLASFFAARSRAEVTAEAALKDLDSRNITGSPTNKLASPRAVCDSAAQKAGRKLADLTSHELAELLAAGWGRNK